MPTKTFSFDHTLPTDLDYARWRLNDENPQATVDGTGAPSPYVWDETIQAMHAKYGAREGTALIAERIALKISTFISSFGENAGIRYSKRNLMYYAKLAELIRHEAGDWSDEQNSTSGYAVGAIKAGKTDTLAVLAKIEEPLLWLQELPYSLVVQSPYYYLDLVE